MKRMTRISRMKNLEANANDCPKAYPCHPCNPWESAIQDKGVLSKKRQKRQNPPVLAGFVVFVNLIFDINVLGKFCLKRLS
jgi:hypothetical protein